jgi:hypothetical protein
MKKRPARATPALPSPRRRGRAAGGAAAGLAALISLAGCGQTLQPRTSAPLDTSRWQGGAMTDASRGFPIAFYADPCAKPAEVEVGGDKLAAAAWLCHLARAMNEELARASLYDVRFAGLGKDLIGAQVEAGRYVYRCAPGAAAKVEREVVRAVELRLLSADRVEVAGAKAARLRVEVRVGRARLTYEAHSSQGTWDVAVFTELGRKILGDASFWEAVKVGW